MFVTRPDHYRDAAIPSRKRAFVTVSDDGSLPLPAEVARTYGLEPCARVCVEELEHQLLLHRPVSRLARVYIEPTSECPFSCATCMRRTWNEPTGQMEPATFSRITDGLREQAQIPSVFFGGFGEPLSHPRALSMIAATKAMATRVELITNGIALDEHVIESLVEMKLDALWVSLDGATEECYDSVRESSALPRIVEALKKLREVKYRRDTPLPALGIAFVAMRRNRQELSQVIDLGLRLGATQFSISNVQPHTEELRDEVVNGRTLGQALNPVSRMDLARMDSGGEWDHAVARILSECGLRFSNGRASTRLDDSCPFVESGSTSIRWDGRVSPCLPLLHSHASFLGDRRREIREASFGALNEKSLSEIWNDEGYAKFRQRLQEFDFPPCTRCNGCDSVDGNQEDCFGNPPPVCGACAWAQGFIVCP